MGSILNFVFESQTSTENIFKNYLHNTIKSNDFHHSAVFSFINNLYTESKDKFSFTNNLNIKTTHKNIFLLECKTSLLDVLKDKDKEINLNNNILLQFINKKKILDSNCTKILISSISEATPSIDIFEEKFVEFCELNSIDTEKFIFIDSNYYIKKFKQLKGIYIPHFILDGGMYLKNFRYISSHENELNYISSIPKISESKKSQREKYFLSFNRSNWKKHRVLLGCFFNEINSNKIEWSYLRKPDETIFDNLHPNEIMEMDEYKFKMYNLWLKNINELKNLVPKELDTIYSSNKISFRTSDTFDKKLILNSYFNIVSESEFSSNSLFFTEKIIKPIIGLQPFIVISTPFYLKNLKKMGFQTFDNVFDESYDNEQNKYKRLNMVFNEINRILNLSSNEVYNLYLESFDRCVFNRNLLKQKYNNLNFEYSKIFKKIENEW